MEQPAEHLSAMSQQKDAPAAIMAGFTTCQNGVPKMRIPNCGNSQK
jgi:hypothetical protein